MLTRRLSEWFFHGGPINFLIMVLLLVFHATPVQARNPHGVPSQAPVLASVTIPFGNLTQKDKGTVRLSSATLGLLHSQGGSSVTSWTEACTSSNCGDWTLYNGAEGSSAILPVPSTAGVTDCLQGGSPCTASATYTFDITATNANGTSQSKVLTINTAPCHATLGNESGVPHASAATFQSKCGVAVDFAVGMDRGQWSGSGLSGTCVSGSGSCRTIQGAAFVGNQGDCSITATAFVCGTVTGTGSGFAAGQYLTGYKVTALTKIVSMSDSTHGVVNISQTVPTTTIWSGISYQYADAARPPPLIDIETIASSSYMIYNALAPTQSTGAALPGSIIATTAGDSYIGVNDLTVGWVAGYGSLNDTSSAFTCVGTSHVVVNNLHAIYSPQGVQEGSFCDHVQLNAPVIQLASDNHLFFGSGSDWEIDDARLIAHCAHNGSGLHVDAAQITDGTGQIRPIWRRLIALDANSCLTVDNAGSPIGLAAPIFSAQSPWVVTGSIDNGSGGAGNILHVTAVQDYLVSVIASTTKPLAGGTMTGAPTVTAVPAGGSSTSSTVSSASGILTVGTLTGRVVEGMAITGGGFTSASSQCHITTNVAGSGSGSTWNVTGCTEAPKTGTFTYVTTHGEGIGDYTISGSPQLVASTTIHTYYTTGGLYDGFIYVGCANVDPNFFSFVDSTFKHATYFHANIAGFAVGACATTGPSPTFSLPTHNGTGQPYDGANVLSDSYFSGTLATLPASFTNARNYFANGANGTNDPACGVSPVCDFVGTTPKATLTAFNWSGATVAQMVAEVVSVLTPSCISGANTYPSGVAIGALTCDGKWNDGSGIVP
jgi:hypothetical protein